MKAATAEATVAIEEFTGSSVLLGLALEREVGAAMEGLGLTGEQMSAALSGGSDEFEKLEGMARNMAFTTDRELVRALRNADDEINEVTTALAGQFAAGEITRDEVRRMLDALDETADAYDDHGEKMDEDAKKTLENAAKQAQLAEILSTSVVENTIAAAKESGNYAYALESLTRRADNAVAGEEARAAALAESEAKQAGFVTMLSSSSAAMAGYHDATEGAAVVVYDAAAAVASVNENLEAGKGPMGQAIEDWNALTAAAMSADVAMLQSASGGTQFSVDDGALSDAAHWAGVVARDRANAAAAEKAAQKAIADELQRQKDSLQAQKDALQGRINAQEDSLALAEDHLAALEAQADAARAPVEALKAKAAAEREGFAALRGMWEAENNLADATQTRVNLISEIADMEKGIGEAIDEATEAYEKQLSIADDLKDTMDDLNDDIEDATSRRLALLESPLPRHAVVSSSRWKNKDSDRARVSRP